MTISRIALLLSLCCLLGSCARGHEVAPRVIAHPDDPAKSIEYFVSEPVGPGPFPTVVLLHGHQQGLRSGGRVFAGWGVLDTMVQRGYRAVAVSLPGYGGSSGPADFCGPFSRRAVEAVIDSVRPADAATNSGLLIHGISRGAIVAGLVAAANPEVTGLVMVSGVFDLADYARDVAPSAEKQAVLDAIAAETDGSDAALQQRSVLAAATSIRAATLILNGARDSRTEPAQAVQLAQRITQSGGTASAVVFPHHGHQIPIAERSRIVDPFIDRVLRADRTSPAPAD